MSAHIPREFVDQLLDKVNIVDIVNSVVSLKKFGANYKACCPFHDEKTPSFVVSPAKQIYHCFGCGLGGNAISFLMEHDRLNFVEAIKELANRLHLKIPETLEKASPKKSEHRLYELLNSATQFYQAQLRCNEKAKTYLVKRGLTGALAKQFALGYAPSSWNALIHFLKKEFSLDEMKEAGLIIQKDEANNYDKFRDRVIFPIHDRQGRVIAFGGRVIDQGEPKYLNSPETAVFHKSHELYGLFHCLKARHKQQGIIIVEGYMDVLALVQQGISNVVATLGTATTEYHIQLLFRYTDTLFFCFDGDEAGKKAAWRALNVCLSKLNSNKSVKFIFLPHDQDPDSFVREKGKLAFETFLSQGLTLAEYLIKHLSENRHLNFPEDKAKFLYQATQLLSLISDEVLRRILAEEVADYARVSLPDILSMIKIPEKKERVLSHLSRLSIPSHLQKILAIIIQYPKKSLSVLSLIEPLSDQYDLLKKIVGFIRVNPDLTSSHLLEYFRDSDYYKILLPLSSQPLLIPEQGLDQELHHALEKIIKEEKKVLMEALLNKAQKTALSEKEKQTLAQWLKAR